MPRANFPCAAEPENRNPPEPWPSRARTDRGEHRSHNDANADAEDQQNPSITARPSLRLHAAPALRAVRHQSICLVTAVVTSGQILRVGPVAFAVKEVRLPRCVAAVMGDHGFSFFPGARSDRESQCRTSRCTRDARRSVSATRIIQLQLDHRRVEIVQDCARHLRHTTRQAVNAFVDLHRVLADDHFDAVIGNLFWKRKLVGKRISCLVPLSIRRNKLLPLRRVHAPASDDVFSPREFFLRPRIEMAK